MMCYLVVGVIYDVIVEPPSIGSTTDERGNQRPVSMHALGIEMMLKGYFIKQSEASDCGEQSKPLSESGFDWHCLFAQ